MSIEQRKIELKKKVIETLLDQGFSFNEKNELCAPELNKETIRQLHLKSRKHILNKDKTWILKKENKVFNFFADGKDIDFENISPKLMRVESTWQSDLFRYATYLWSIPVSRGFGRNIRYLVFDENNGKLIGIFALGDPVISLKSRDEFIGWNRMQKENRLWHVMDAYVLGAIPPYNHLLGGKLIASLVTSKEVRQDFKNKYDGKKAIISGKIRKGHLVLITTNTALGKSSMLSRLTFSNNGFKEAHRKLWEHIGWTAGNGHFHFDNGLFDEMIDFLREKDDPIVNKYEFGNGPHWKMRVIKKCLKELDLNYGLIKHGVKRGLYFAPLAVNYKEFLLGEENEPNYYNQSVREISEYFKSRYLIPRIEKKKQEVKDFDRESIRVSSLLDKL